MFNGNAFKLGLFALNASGGLTMTKAPDRWDASWEHNLDAARLADAAGLEFLLPIGRWHGYAGETDTQGTSFETLTWACGLLAATQRITVFGTLHVAFVNPVFAAKQIVTAHHIGRGRFGLNLVSGWNAGEFEMFGVPLEKHDRRYAYTQEWLTIVKRLWDEAEPFDFTGQFFNLKGVLAKPKPYGERHPFLISAGNSPGGRDFAARNADGIFMTMVDLASLPAEIASLRTAFPRVDIFASGHLICRATRKEAEEYYRFIVHDMGDWEAAEHAARIRAGAGGTSADALQRWKERLIGGLGTFPVIGSYDDAAACFGRMSEAGLDGMALGLVDYTRDLAPLRDELLPRMERLGLRTPI